MSDRSNVIPGDPTVRDGGEMGATSLPVPSNGNGDRSIKRLALGVGAAIAAVVVFGGDQ